MTNNKLCALEIDFTGTECATELAAQIIKAANESLLHHGAVRFKTSALNSVSDFHGLLDNMGCELLNYEFGSTPRKNVQGKVYTSTEYPADQEIILHNEMAYTTQWPEQLWFYCDKADCQGGETPIADSREIYRSLDSRITKTFEQKELIYIRNYRPGLDLPWQEVFNTQDPLEVAKACQRLGVEFEFKAKGKELKTTQKCQSIAVHPKTGEKVWFNQAHLFHASNLAPEYREIMEMMYAEDELPRNVMFGDGSKMDEGMLSEIREVMSAHKQIFQWQPGEVMLVDNLLCAHGREPFVGERKIVVAMN
jgi:alpha-ketoglutarate-dependent taurine dioxygenase